MKIVFLSTPMISKRAFHTLLVLIVLTWFSANLQAIASGPKPTVEMTSLFKLNMYPTGSFNIQQLDLIFTPDDAEIQIVLKTLEGEEIQIFRTLPGFSFTNEAFSRVNMDGYTQANIGPGEYVVETIINGDVATRLPFSVVSEASADAFTTTKKFHFKGPWQKLGYLHYTKSRNFTDSTDYQLLNFRIWGGFDDLSEGSSGENLTATLLRDENIFGHSKKTTGFLSSNKEINRVDLVIFKPHTDETEANVLGLAQAELVDGNHNYRLTVTRQGDGKVIRDFEFESRNGQLLPLPRTEFGHMPQHHYLAPRALIHGTQRYEFEPVYWLEMK